MPMTSDQAKASVTEAILGGVSNITGLLCNTLSADSQTNEQSVQQFAAGVAHLRQVEAIAHRIIDKAYESPKEEPKATESDDDYRARLTRIVGTASVHSPRLQMAVGRGLDDIGANYDVKRK